MSPSSARNPYLESLRRSDERYGELARGKRNFQIIAIAMAGVSLVLAIGMVMVARQSRVVPYPVLVDSLGYAITIPHPLNPSRDGPILERVERYEVAAFIRDARGVSSDPGVEQWMLDQANGMARGAANHTLANYYRADDYARNPFKVGAKETVSVHIDSVLGLSAHSYQVRWSETRRDKLSGAPIATTHWTAALTTAVDPPKDGEALIDNPLGVFISSLQWSQEQ